MADIFISYSSKDREKAEQLTELLSSAGLSVWIDQSGIDVATSWSGEIVDAIEGCKAFVVLLSPNSIDSVNVVKEVSLAAERRKKILPLDLEPVALPRDLAYHLAGIQRAPMTNIDAIIRAIGKLGLEATQAPTMKLVKEIDSRKSLMILPFEDLSPTGDNGWFADGLVSELISALTNIKTLRVADFQSTKDYKTYQGRITDYAREFSVRYFVEGQVRKFGENIKISVSLLDIETGDHLWQDALKGTMGDIFEIQETVAEKVVAGLKLHLSEEEKAKITDRGTQNAEAYELYMVARSYYALQTRQSHEHAMTLCEQAVELDPEYVDAYFEFVVIALAYYRRYKNDATLLVRAASVIEQVEQLAPDSWTLYNIKAKYLNVIGKVDEAIAQAKKLIEKDPTAAGSYDTFGYIYLTNDMAKEAAEAYEKALVCDPNCLTYHFNATVQYFNLKEFEKCKVSAERALPHYEKRVRRHPEEQNTRTNYAVMLHLADRDDEAVRELEIMLSQPGVDAAIFYNASITFLDLGRIDRGLGLLTKAIELGFPSAREALKGVHFDRLREHPKFVAILQLAEQKATSTNG